MQAPQHNRPGSGLGVIGELLSRLVTVIIGVIDEFTERSAERRRERGRDRALRRDQATAQAAGRTQPPPDHSSDSARDRTRPPTQDGEPPPEGPQMLVSIYLADEPIHAHVEGAVEAWLASAGLAVEERDPPVLGSWFRRLRAGLNRAVESGLAEDVALTVQAADTRLSVYQDAQVTALLLQNLGPVITSLQPTKDAVIRAGALLIVKVDWQVQVFQLTAAQKAKLNQQPHLAWSPREIVAALRLTSSEAREGLPVVE